MPSEDSVPPEKLSPGVCLTQSRPLGPPPVPPPLSGPSARSGVPPPLLPALLILLRRGSYTTAWFCLQLG